MRRAVDRAVLLGEVNIAVAAEAGVAGPLVPRKGDETSGIVEGTGQLVQRIVKTARYLKIVALVPDYVERGEIASEMKIVQGRGGADRLLALAVQITQ
jgi:hypothetical protein